MMLLNRTVKQCYYVNEKRNRNKMTIAKKKKKEEGERDFILYCK